MKRNKFHPVQARFLLRWLFAAGGSVKVRDLEPIGVSRETVADLRDMGLIAVKGMSLGGFPVNRYELTPHGKRVALMLEVGQP